MYSNGLADVHNIVRNIGNFLFIKVMFLSRQGNRNVLAIMSRSLYAIT